MHQIALGESQSVQRFIKYRHDLAQKYHDPILPFMIHQFEFWFTKQRLKKAKFPKEKIEANVFYKFISPPHEHHFYRKGDSWTEELCITADVFRLHFKKIGVPYKSYSLFKAAQEKGDVFEGKRYASYYNRLKRQVFFVKNTAYDEKRDLGIDEQDKRDFSKINQPKPPSQKKLARAHLSNDQTLPSPSIISSRTQSTDVDDIELNRDLIISSDVDVTDNLLNQLATTTDIKSSATVQSSHSDLNQDHQYTQKLEDPVNQQRDEFVTQSPTKISTDDDDDDRAPDQLSTNSSFSTVSYTPNTFSRKPSNTVSNARVLSHSIRAHSISLKEKESVDNFILEKTLSQRMIEIWQQQIGDTQLKYTSTKLPLQLYQILQDSFQGSLFNWLDYCQKIASSKFLMGEGKAWTFKKVYLLWAIKPENIVKINSQAISLGDRSPTRSLQESKLLQQRSILIKEINALQDQLNDGDQPKSITVEVEQLRRATVKDQVEAIIHDRDSAQLNAYQQQFEEMLKKGDKDDPNWHYAQCIKYSQFDQWRERRSQSSRALDVWWYFESYLTNLLADQYFKRTQSKMIAEKVQATKLQLEQLQQKLAQVNFGLKLQ